MQELVEATGINELIVFRDRLANRGCLCRLGFFVSVGDFTDRFHRRADTFREDDMLVVPTDFNDLKELVASQD